MRAIAPLPGPPLRFRQPCRVVGSENKWNCANTPDTRTSSPQGCILHSHINSSSKFSINIEKYLPEWYAFQSDNFCDSLWMHVLPYSTYLSLLSVVMLKPKSKCRLKISYILGHYSLKRGKKVVLYPWKHLFLTWQWSIGSNVIERGSTLRA